MPITVRPFAGEADWLRVADLIRAAPEVSRHIVDYPWRLASPALATGQDAMLAIGDNSELVGAAVWQVYWAALDVWLAPGAANEDAEVLLFAWSEGSLARS
jgi:hypothetical protein